MELYDYGRAASRRNSYEHPTTNLATGNTSDVRTNGDTDQDHSNHVRGKEVCNVKVTTCGVGKKIITLTVVVLTLLTTAIGLSAYMTVRLLTLEETILSVTQTRANYQDCIITCPQPYIKNPYSNTCIRVVALHMNWTTAKAECESAGENLAVFETYDSVMWLQNFLNKTTTPAEWKQRWIRIGLRPAGGVWRWRGRSGRVLASDDKSWDTDEPDDSTSDNSCGCVERNEAGLHDCSCDGLNLYHICERN